MKKQIPCFFILITSCLVNANAQQVFQHSVNDYSCPYVSGVMVSDNEKRFFITAGNIDTPYATKNFSIMLKCDSNGNIEWEHFQVEYDTSEFKNMALDGMIQIDTTYLVAANCQVRGRSTAYLLHYSRSGILLDHHAWRGDTSEIQPFIPKLITLTSDRDVVLAGNWGYRKLG